MLEAHSSHKNSNRTGLLDEFLVLADEWIAQRADEVSVAWFRAAINGIASTADDRSLGVAIGLAPRRLGKADLSLPAVDMGRVQALRPGLDLSDWSVDQLARVAFMAASHRNDDASFAQRFDTFCTTAGISELIALCRGLPIYPNQALFEPRAREAIRSGMKPVFEAVAHRNPYPRETFAEEAWNQMVVKAFFIGSTLWPIQGLDERANPRLARMLVGLAQERWAAGRVVSSEMWRCVAPHADDEGAVALLHAWSTGSDKDRMAVALALQDISCAFTQATAVEIKNLQTRLATEKISWRDLA